MGSVNGASALHSIRGWKTIKISIQQTSIFPRGKVEAGVWFKGQTELLLPGSLKGLMTENKNKTKEKENRPLALCPVA